MHSPHLKRPAVQSFRSNNNKLLSSLYLHVPSLLCCGKESLSRLSRFRLFWFFCCWLTPITLTVLCVSTCSDGLLDFHTSEKRSLSQPNGGAGHSCDLRARRSFEHQKSLSERVTTSSNQDTQHPFPGNMQVRQEFIFS